MVTERVVVAIAPLLSIAGLGAKLQVEPSGIPLCAQENITVLVYEVAGLIVSCAVPVCPAVTVIVDVFGPRMKSGEMTVIEAGVAEPDPA